MQSYHTLCVGDTGSGKTTYLRSAHSHFGETHGASIWINHTDTKRVSGSRASGLVAMQNADRPLINYQTTSSDLIKACEDARRFAIDWFDRTGHPCQIILDECQEVLGKEIPAEHPLSWILHQGRESGIKCLLSTQDPSDLQPNYSRIKQCRYFVWIGLPSSWHDGFIRYFRIPRDELPKQDYDYVTFDKSMKPLYKGRTDPTHG